MPKKYINIQYQKTCIIYALVSGNDINDIKYVGITIRTLNSRVNNHIYVAKHFPNKTKKNSCFKNLQISSVYFKEQSLKR